MFIVHLKHCLFTAMLFIIPMLTTSAQVHVVVMGKEAKEDIREKVKFFADFLGIKNEITICVTFNPHLGDGVKGYTLFEVTQGSTGASISIHDQLGNHDELIVLAHEMIHVNQFIRGQLKVNSEKDVFWRKSTFNAVEEIPYQDRPWEKEALFLEKRLANLYKNYEKTKAAYHAFGAD